MAVLNSAADPTPGPVAKPAFSAHTGPFGALARVQYFALARMRWSMFRNGLRSNRGTMELGARSVTLIVYSLIGLGLGVGLGIGAYVLTVDNMLQILPALIWGIFLLWQVMPITLASFQEQFDMGGLLRFPVGFGPFYLLHLIFGLVDISTIMGALACLGIWLGITIARPDLSAWTALALGIFAAFNILLVRAVFAWIDRWLAQRRTREILGAIFFIALLSLQLLNPAFGVVKYRNPGGSEAKAARQQRKAAFGTWIKSANSVQRWLPPGLAASTVERASRQKPVEGLEDIGVVGLYVLAAGGVLAARLRAEYRGENLGEAPSRKKAERHTGKWLIEGTGPMGAVMEKELRVLARALPLLYGLGAPLLMVFVLSGLYRKGASVAGHPLPIALLISLAYAMVGFTQLFYNNLGAEGAGIQLLFLSPTPIRTVILAKNLFHAVLFSVDAVLVCIVASFRFSLPSPLILVATAAWLLFALPVHLAAGNLFSLNMPYRINLSRMTRQRGSQASSLLSMLIQLAVLGVGTGIFALCSVFDMLWLAVPVFLAMAAVAALVWMRILSNVDAIANRRRDLLISTLVKAE
jgi:ABC-2 type transport system permease protein